MVLKHLEQNPKTIQFNDVITYINEHYDFRATAFKNGNIINKANQNNGSCKIFSFGKLMNLSEAETLILFGDFYRNDVLKNPEGSDHQNIRNFMQFGWDGISFERNSLKQK